MLKRFSTFIVFAFLPIPHILMASEATSSQLTNTFIQTQNETATQNATAGQNDTSSVNQVYATTKIILTECVDFVPPRPSQFLAESTCRFPGVEAGDSVFATISLQPPGPGGFVILDVQSLLNGVHIITKNLASSPSIEGRIQYSLMIFKSS